MNDPQKEIEEYGDPGIATADAKIPLFLILTYICVPIWAIFTSYYYWNGSVGWLDRGYWKQLQVAANTTFPLHNANLPEEESQRSTEQKNE